MAIETQPESAQAPGGGDPGATQKERAWWLRPNVLTAIVGAVIGYYLGHWLGNFLGSQYQQVATSDDLDMAIVLGYAFLIVGWLIGLGVFNDLVRQMLGKPLNGNGNGHAANGGLAKYFRFTLDHKVVGLQYLIGMLVYFFTGGLLAMAIRTELLSPTTWRYMVGDMMW
jgi:cytochrome c oxidase subunit 1